jgi:hypothetical protein
MASPKTGLTLTSRTVTVPINPDTVVEGDETFEIVLFDPVGAGLGQARAVGSIIDDDDQPAGLRISVGDVDVVEGVATTKFNGAVAWLTLSEESQDTHEVTVSFVTGTATEGEDFAPITKRNSRTLTIRPGKVRIAIKPKLFPDLVVEGDETFTIVLSDPSTGLTIGRGTATVTILDDD